MHLEIINWTDKKNKLKKFCQVEKYEHTSPEQLTTNYFHKKSTHSYKWESKQITKENLEIERILSEELQEFSRVFDFDKVEITSSWFQSSINGQYHDIHNHGSTGYSAVCFIDFDQKHHKPTNFLSPFNNVVTGTSVVYQPENIREGSLIFFPSVIHHYAPPNYTKIPRLILSFNLKVG